MNWNAAAASATGGAASGAGAPPRLARATRRAGRQRLDPLRTSLLIMTVLTLSRIHQHFGFIGVLRPALLLSLFSLVLAMMYPHLVETKGLLKTWPAKAVAGIGIVACCSAVFGISIGSSGRYFLETFSKVLIFAFLLIAVLRSGTDLRIFAWGYAMGAGLLAWMAITIFEVSDAGGCEYRLNDLYTYDANEAGTIMVVGLVFSALTFQTSGTRGKLVSAVMMFALGMAIAKTGSRGAFLGMLVAGILLLLFMKGVSFPRRIAFLLVTVVALAHGAPPGYWKRMNSLKNPKDDYNWTSTYGRKQTAIRGMKYMMSYPVFGLGINNFPRAEGTISEQAKAHVAGTGISWISPHNSFVQAGAEMGIPGLILYTGLLFGGAVQVFLIRRRLPQGWARGDPDQRFLYHMAVYLPIALIGFAVSAFFVSFAYADPMYILAALTSGVLVAVERQRRAGPAPAPVRRRQRGALPIRGHTAGPLPRPGFG